MTEVKNTLFVAGVDEAGRGPLAGPVTAACIVHASLQEAPYLNDSKKLTAARREQLYGWLVETATAYAVVSVGHRRIETLNIREATRLAMRLAIRRVYTQLQLRYGSPLHLCALIDGNMTAGTNSAFRSITEEAIVKGDARVKVISAASIVAKVTRDRLMQQLEQQYPGYGFAGHKGYPTKTHREAVKQLGPSPVHRRTFAGVREFVPSPKGL